MQTDEEEVYLLQTLKSLGYHFIHENVCGFKGTLLKGKSFVSCAIGKMSLEKEK